MENFDKSDFDKLHFSISNYFLDKSVCYENSISHTDIPMSHIDISHAQPPTSSTPHEDPDYSLNADPGENQLTPVLPFFFLDFMLFT